MVFRMNNWIDINDKLPNENETVWLYNIKTKFVALGALVWSDCYWIFATTNGIIEEEDGKISAECELDYDWEVTHWHALPELPR